MNSNQGFYQVVVTGVETFAKVHIVPNTIENKPLIDKLIFYDGSCCPVYGQGAIFENKTDFLHKQVFFGSILKVIHLCQIEE